MENLRFNIINLKTVNFKTLGKVVVPDTFYSSSKIFHSEGLFSSDIFGAIGSPERNTTYGWIDLRLPVIHPEVYEVLTKASRFYIDVLKGIKYAKFNKKTKLLEPSDIENGETGFSFFMSHLPTLSLAETGSNERIQAINLLVKKREELSADKLIVVPAGLRDYSTDEDGRSTENAINDLYRSIIHITSLIPPGTPDTGAMDQLRYRIQVKFHEISKYIDDYLYGKKKLINAKVASRDIFGGTRNIATGLNQTDPDLDSPNFVDVNTTVMGLFQFVKAAINTFSNSFRNGFLTKAFPGEGVDFAFIDKKTLKSARLPYDYKTYDNFMTPDGVNKLVNRVKETENYSLVLEFGGYYLAMIHDTTDEYIVISDISELPEKLDPKDLRPVTLMDLIYLNALSFAGETFGTFTRYPVLNLGGIYPTKYVVKPTVRHSIKYEINSSGERTGTVGLRYPDVESGIYNSISTNLAHAEALGLD